MSDMNRPQCSVPGCNNQAANQVAKSSPRYPYYRRSNWIKKAFPGVTSNFCCGTCHQNQTAKRNGVKSAKHLTAKRQGMSITAYNNRYHPYLRFRKTYCENQDGRLGFVCNTVLPTQAMIDAAGLDWTPIQFLEVDHINGNHTNNDPKNLQTLCKCCHMIKGAQNGDNLTPGRKTRKKYQP